MNSKCVLSLSVIFVFFFVIGISFREPTTIDVVDVASVKVPAKFERILSTATVRTTTRISIRPEQEKPEPETKFVEKFLLLESHPPSWMGLTNQIILLSEIIYIAISTKRTAIVLPPPPFPQSSASSFSTSIFDSSNNQNSSFQIIDFERIKTSNQQIKFFSHEEFLVLQMKMAKTNKFSESSSSFKLKLPSRNHVMNLPDSVARKKARQQFEAAMKKGSEFQILKFAKKSSLSSILWHVPFISSSNEKEKNDSMNQLTAAEVFNSVEFSRTIHQKAAEFLESNKVNFDDVLIAFHLRLEPDIVGFSTEFSPPPPEKLRKFLRELLLPKLKEKLNFDADNDKKKKLKKLNILLLGGSSLDSKFIQVVKEEFEQVLGFAVAILMTKKSFSSDKNVEKSATMTTNNFDAAVDSVVALSSSIVIGADYSTFTRAIQIRKCFNKKKGSKFETLFLYDHKLTRVEEEDEKMCEQSVFQNVFATTPHSYIPKKERNRKEKQQ